MCKTSRYTVTIAVLISLSALVGCSSKDRVIPPSEVSAEEVLDNTMGDGQRDYRIMTSPQIAGVQPDMDVYELHNSPKPRYQTLPNPKLYIFIPAHLSGQSRMPVPAYISETHMFDRDEYALPGELYPLQDARYSAGQKAADHMTYQD